MTLADRWGRDLTEVQQSTTSTDFVKWSAFLTHDYNTPSRTDFYLMQIAAQIEKFMQGFREKPAAVKIGTYVITFEKAAPDSSQHKTLSAGQAPRELTYDSSIPELAVAGYIEGELDPERVRRVSELSKGMWGMALTASRQEH